MCEQPMCCQSYTLLSLCDYLLLSIHHYLSIITLLPMQHYLLTTHYDPIQSPMLLPSNLMRYVFICYDTYDVLELACQPTWYVLLESCTYS